LPPRNGGADGAYFQVHHFARQLASPFPLLAAVGAKTSRVEIGTTVTTCAQREYLA
jgi:alkanesulfonate monooxygenase SsuD/methylene tetrahydromethanopterin reductase-like flavin-dependent oxidoreductase (luciferase family)